MKKVIAIVVIGFLSGIGGAWMYNNFLTPTKYENSTALVINRPDGFEEMEVSTGSSTLPIPDMDEDFVMASARSTRSVVYIKNISSRSYGYSFYDWFFGEGGRSIETVSSGSGVILTDDGYIVTNNHVIKGADKIEVVHNRRTFEADLIGTDPSSDLAVLKIDAKDLTPIEIGNSRDVQVGEWVVAVGNPFNLTSTVTAGIVSAKGRELKIMESNFPIESFIQTDAAINPGNSGGALVNKDGQLIGINTAILSKTGSYAGYGFAVPSDVVKKIVKDIIEYGEVQKAFFGANVSDLDSDIVERLDLNVNLVDLNGVVIDLIVKAGAADNAGLKEGDIILAIDDNKITSRSDFEEVLSYHSPGDIVTVGIVRNNNSLEKRITLTNREGTTDILKREVYSSEYLGADLENVSKVERDVLEIDHGVKIIKVYDRGLMKSLGLDEGFIVTYINYTKIDSPEELTDALKNYRGRVRIEGVDPSGRKGYYTFYLR